MSWFLLTLIVAAAPKGLRAEDPPSAPASLDRQAIQNALKDVSNRLSKLSGDAARGDRLADARIFEKGIVWALRYDRDFTPADVRLVQKAVDRVRQRVEDLEKENATWLERKGKVVRGFVSQIDGSVQPYAVIVPKGYDRGRPIRLDVVLHGSTRPVGISELRFLSRFDEGDDPSANPPDAEYIELYPLGRVENGYRWAGETDVFEAIEAVCRNYNIDRDRIVLRGMSMGASGTWHLGLKHPDRFVALGPYCGYVDTHQFSRTKMPNFVEVGTLPEDQERMLHLLDSVDYAANAGVVPSIACMGEKDIFFEAHEIMGRAMAKEGLTMVNLISPGTGHVIDPVTHREQLRRIGEIASRGLDHAPRQIRFVTWTLAYSRCHWLQVLGLGRHYERAEIQASVEGDTVRVEPRNVERFAILPPVVGSVRKIQVGDDLITIPEGVNRTSPRGLVVARQGGRWALAKKLLRGKRPGLQGPIDAVFTAPFLCVRGTGTPWNPTVQAWADAQLSQFATEWNHYFRGELPVKDDTAVTEEDARKSHLILFGDPGSNAWIRKVLPSIPVRWTRDECAIGPAKGASASHAPVLIQPNPLAPERYVVLNSGHTFHEKELSTLNYLLFPRLGDWAVVNVTDPKRPASPETAVGTGFFDEDWKVPANDKSLRSRR